MRLEGAKWHKIFLVNVVLASPGYADKPKIGYRIYGLEEAAKEGAWIFHAGTKLNKRGDFFLTNGGRVLSVVGRGETIEKAREMAYRAVGRISFGNRDPKKGKQVYLEDIALFET